MIAGGPCFYLDRKPDKRAGAVSKAVGTRKGLGCKSSAIRSEFKWSAEEAVELAERLADALGLPIVVDREWD